MLAFVYRNVTVFCVDLISCSLAEFHEFLQSKCPHVTTTQIKIKKIISSPRAFLVSCVIRLLTLHPWKTTVLISTTNKYICLFLIFISVHRTVCVLLRLAPFICCCEIYVLHAAVVHSLSLLYHSPWYECTTI